MRFFSKAKDGGPKSTVTGYWLIELKSLFSIVLLKFEDGSRDEFHSHAFDSLNWVLKGRVVEQVIQKIRTRFGAKAAQWYKNQEYTPSVRPVVTRRSRFHRVRSVGTTWVLSLRGPWSKTWEEYDPKTDEFTTLTHGRNVIPECIIDLYR